MREVLRSTAARQIVARATSGPHLRPPYLLYADKGIIILNKPPGLVCQSDKGFEQVKKLPYLKTELRLDDIPKQIHRLDRYTTGAYLLAKSNVHARALLQQFREHSIKKTYLAVVRGGRKSFPSLASGSINVPLSVRDERTVVDERNGRPALTDWELLGSSSNVPLSLLRVSLHSGLKHQLRVHLSQAMQVPILGDTFYSEKAPLQSILDIVPKDVTVVSQQTQPEGPTGDPEKSTHRLYLHSAHIDVIRYRSFGSHKRVILGVSAPVPWYFRELCKSAGLSQYIPPEYINGGLSVNRVPIQLNEEVAGLDGKWLGP
ncbi:pseudouridine synthase [Fomitiporia mediterranea MF3/22]|uniref:pseudouridine synthase n=1 Tax=Fomitiporia mediterranea (strain MF3/22) TaxID=694068 RepID=UPI0004408DC6|nr:pseudouridine synthase [Fomitiporia mediterranea MF3/22]EJD04710.1 pseudouridine synthase [Fomitiporia mediterranea MF3/22]